MYNLALLLLGAAFLISFIAYTISNKQTRNVLLNRFGLRRDRSSGSLTPPRSLSPEKKTHLEEHTAPDYKDVFPPSRRHALAELDVNAISINGLDGRALSKLTSDTSLRVPDKEPVHSDGLSKHTTPTGFTMEEITALGQFPDYATLSGVPLPEPHPTFDINKALPRPYRPVRWPYHQTMSLTKLDPNYWLELESTYTARIAQRQALYATHGTSVLNALPGSEHATKELMEMSLQFLCTRYPQYFTLCPSKTHFHNAILQTTTPLHSTPPLIVILNNIPEDFALVLRCPLTGSYTLRAGIICSSLGWSLGTKISLSLSAIHGPIPDYATKMAFSMDRYFAKKPTDKPIQRGSWGLEIGTPLFMPADDPHATLRERQDPDARIEDVNLRVDWQTLRRLPLSGAVVFNFKALFTPLTELRREPCVPKLLLKVLREGKRELMLYKGTWHTEHVVLPKLEEWSREQEEKGLVEEGWEPRTLDQSPFYPGWEDLWRGRQGF